ncbi:hypothetical protein MMC30_004158 [Trapelia coarctata]|nr:hypothetical protein [Trapelia coarctata]
MPSRPDYSANYSSGLDGTYDTYGVQSGSYVLPAQETPASSSLYGNADNLRQWSSVGHLNRANFGFDHDLPPKYVSSNIPYGEAVLPSGSGSTDTSSLFPVLGSIASALPLPNPLRNSDRVLPSPRAGLGVSSLENLMGSNHNLVGEPASFLSQHTSAKSGAQWPPDRGTTGRSRTPKSTVSSSTSAYSITATDGRPSSSSQEASQTAFGYIEHTPPTGSTTPTIEYNSTNNNSKPNVSAGTMQNHLLASSTYESGMLSEPLLRRDFSSPNLYTYTTGNGSKDDSQSSFSDGTLLNGQPYTRLRQPQSQPQQVKAYDARRRDSGETGSHLSHRTSVASVGSSNREKLS